MATGLTYRLRTLKPNSEQNNSIYTRTTMTTPNNQLMIFVGPESKRSHDLRLSFTCSLSAFLELAMTRGLVD